MQELRAALELALLKGELEVPAAMAQLETKEKGKFRKLNAQVRDATGVGAEKKPKEPKETVQKAAVNPAKKPPPKDPLVAVKNAGKVAKSQPVTKNKSVTVNLTINMPSTAAAAAPAPAKKPARAKAAAAGSAPKPRAEKKAKVAVSDPGYFASSTTQEPKPMPKQTARRGRGGAPKAAAPVQQEPGVPRTKQTARCTARGGLAKSAPRVKKEVVTPAWVGKDEDDDGDVYMSEYFQDGASDHAGYSDREEEPCWTGGAF